MVDEVRRIPAAGPPKYAAVPLERRIAELAARQHGVVSGRQLRALGLGDRTIRDRVACGNLHRIHRGVFAVGHPLLSKQGRWMAAVLACGPRALLSHRSAAALWELRPDNRLRVDVSRPTRAASREGLVVHTVRSLAAHDRAIVRGIPCTSAARTLLDLAEVLNRRQLERACNQAEVMQLLTVRELDSVLATRGRRATSVLREVLGDDGRADTVTRSDLEERFLALCRAARLPQPRVNAWIALDAGEGVEVDFLWAGRRVVAEADGRAFHRTRQAFESDRRRDQRLAAAGYTVVRFTWRQVSERPREVTATLGRLLSPP